MIQGQLELLSLPPAAVRTPAEPIVREASIEDNYRWTMRRAWGAGPVILWCLLNPSEANDRRDDPTTQRMMGFSYRWGFGSMVVVNVYPFISPNPEALDRWKAHWSQTKWWESGGAIGCWEFDKSALNAWIHNMDVVREEIGKTTTHVAAWGNGADADQVKDFLDEVTWHYDLIGPDRYKASDDLGERIEIAWKCLGTTAAGAPIHPLARGKHRVPDDAVLVPWTR